MSTGRRWGIAFVILFIAAASVYLVSMMNEDSTGIERIDLKGDLVKAYKDAKELFDNADMVAEVEINHVQATSYGGVVFTLSDATISRMYKGENDKNSITILETGGIFENKNYVFEGNEAFKGGEKAVVYLQKYTGGITDQAYVILGAYQGKFLKTERGLIPPNEVSDELEQIRTEKDLGLQ